MELSWFVVLFRELVRMLFDGADIPDHGGDPLPPVPK